MPKCFEKVLNTIQKPKLPLLIAIGSFGLVSDVLAKYLIEKNIPYGCKIDVCSCFSIVNVHNYGITFGLFHGAVSAVLLGCLSILISIGIAFWIANDRRLLLGGSLVITGALGNAIDRFIYGYVVDFLDFYIKNYHWPAFNIADIFIVLGNFIILLISLCYNKS